MGHQPPNIPYPILRHITTVPTAGEIMLDRQIMATTSTTTATGIIIKSQKMTKTFIRYIERATGQIYDTLTDALDITRISNTTFPKVYNAYFDATGSSTILMTIPDENLIQSTLTMEAFED